MTLFGCRHRHLSRVWTLNGRTYRCCTDCGREFDYSLQLMRPVVPRKPIREQLVGEILRKAAR